MQIEVILVHAQGIEAELLTLPEGATVADAHTASQFSNEAGDAYALWGRKVRPEERLTSGARVEICRALICDPKLVRRERALAQGDIRVITAGRHGGRKHHRVKNP